MVLFWWRREHLRRHGDVCGGVCEHDISSYRKGLSWEARDVGGDDGFGVSIRVKEGGIGSPATHVAASGACRRFKSR
jgi:hypothetical protein